MFSAYLTETSSCSSLEFTQTTKRRLKHRSGPSSLERNTPGSKITNPSNNLQRVNILNYESAGHQANDLSSSNSSTLKRQSNSSSIDERNMQLVHVQKVGYSGYTQTTLRLHSGYTQATHRLHTGYTQATHRARFSGGEEFTI